MAGLFEFLFKYRPALFDEGRFALAAPGWMQLAALLAGAALVFAAFTYRRMRPGPSGGAERYRWLPPTLRTLAIAVLVLCLLQPALVLSTVVPQESFVGILIDDSGSMAMPDEDAAEDGTRGGAVREALSGEPGSLLELLEQRFQVRQLAFGRGTERIESGDQLRFARADSRIGEALVAASDELAGLPLAGIVLLSDGADSAPAELGDALLALKAAGTPVHSVGLGREGLEKDVEVSRVVAPRRVLQGSTVEVEVTLSQTGFGGRSVNLEVEDDGRIVNVEPVTFPRRSSAVTARVMFAASDSGAREFRFRVAEQPGEGLILNNERIALVEVTDRKEKIFFFEGEPRDESKFLRRAVQFDENLHVVSMTRQAANKFYGINFDEDTKRFDGFPTRREDLFEYQGIILGSMEASFFTHDQMRMLVDFAAQRGGGVLLLGSRRSFSEGGFAGTPVAELSPLVLYDVETPSGEARPELIHDLVLELTAQGRAHPATLLRDDRAESNDLWSTLPRLSAYQRATEVKAGATALLSAETPMLREPLVALAHHRIGRGRAIAFTPHDSWHWQMSADIPLEDQTHERLWRQMLRWLVSYVPDQVEVETDRDRFEPGSTVTLRAMVRDAAFREVNRAQVTATIELPSGDEAFVPLDWSVERDGEFVGTFVTGERGHYKVEVDATSEGELLGVATSRFTVDTLNEELFGAARRDSVLGRIADETGGRQYELDEMERLVEDLSVSREGTTVREARDLWDMPILFLLLVALLGGEWAVRRRLGMA